MFRNHTYTGTAGCVLDYPAVGSLPAVQIPMTLTDYKVPTRNPKMNTVKGIPLFHTASNNTVGGFMLGQGVMELPKFTIAGFMDTPARFVGTNMLPALQWSGGEYFTYGDYIAMMTEGRGLLNSEFNYAIVDPNYYRDPYGREYKIRIIEFSAQYQEGRPLRQNFNMSLQITQGYYT